VPSTWALALLFCHRTRRSSSLSSSSSPTPASLSSSLLAAKLLCVFFWYLFRAFLVFQKVFQVRREGRQRIFFFETDVYLADGH
jgi:hypothetical protein